MGKSTISMAILSIAILVHQGIIFFSKLLANQTRRTYEQIPV